MIAFPQGMSRRYQRSNEVPLEAAVPRFLLTSVREQCTFLNK